MSLTRRTPLRTNPNKLRAWQKRSARRLPSVGKKAKQWSEARREGDKTIADHNIRSCEIKLPGCLTGMFLQRCHLKKRRNLTREELAEFVIGCTSCHAKVELMKESAMEAHLRGIIDARKTAWHPLDSEAPFAR